MKWKNLVYVKGAVPTHYEDVGISVQSRCHPGPTVDLRMGCLVKWPNFDRIVMNLGLLTRHFAKN